jgi:hypothetical protein
MSLQYDWEKTFLPFDICVTRNKDLLGAGIDFKEVYNYDRNVRHEWIGQSLADAIAKTGNLSIGTHSLYFVGIGRVEECGQVFIPDPNGVSVGFEMNPPCVHYLDLSCYVPDQNKPNIVAAFRNPWLRQDALSCAPGRDRMQKWITYWNGQHLKYGYDAIERCFDPDLPVNVQRPDCSMFTGWGWHVNFDMYGLDCKMPKEWFSPMSDPTYMLTPYYQQQAFNENGFGIPLFTKESA